MEDPDAAGRDFGQPAVILVEGDGFGFLEQQSGGNPGAYAAVAATGIPELAGLPNTVAGWGLAFLQLRAAQDGVIGVFFGGGAGGMSNYTNDVYTDGQLFMMSRAGAFVNSGGLPIN